MELPAAGPMGAEMAESARIRAKRPKLSSPLSRLVIAFRLPPGQGHDLGPGVLLPSSVTPAEGLGPAVSHQHSHSCGKRAEPGRRWSHTAFTELGAGPGEWLGARRCLQLKRGHEEERWRWEDRLSFELVVSKHLRRCPQRSRKTPIWKQ